jgi:hypothetical protein
MIDLLNTNRLSYSELVYKLRKVCRRKKGFNSTIKLPSEEKQGVCESS